MDTTAYIALSRQVALQRDMAVVANNVANVATSGFKARHMLFEQVLEQAGGGRDLAFVQDVGQRRDLAAGPLASTGDPFDLAIEGEGYFAVATATGIGYTRAGHFGLDAAGQLVTAAGEALLDDGGSPIALPPGGGVPTIAGDGTMSTRAGIVGRLGLVAFADEQALQDSGNGLFTTDEVPRPAGGRLVQGMIEGSNVQPVAEMTRLIGVQRAFEGTQRMLETHHDMERRAIERILSVAS